jgi:hypothetical protein
MILSNLNFVLIQPTNERQPTHNDHNDCSNCLTTPHSNQQIQTKKPTTANTIHDPMWAHTRCLAINDGAAHQCNCRPGQLVVLGHSFVPFQHHPSPNPCPSIETTSSTHDHSNVQLLWQGTPYQVSCLHQTPMRCNSQLLRITQSRQGQRNSPQNQPPPNQIRQCLDHPQPSKGMGQTRGGWTQQSVLPVSSSRQE